MQAVIETDKGDIRLELYPDQAPITVASFVNLAERGYYDGTTFHRVVPNFRAEAQNVEVDSILAELLEKIAVA